MLLLALFVLQLTIRTWVFDALPSIRTYVSLLPFFVAMFLIAQYTPLNDTFVYNGITNMGGTYQL